MNKKVIYSTLLILLASCTSELPTAPDLNGQEQGVPVHFSVTIEPEKDEFSRSAITGYYLPDNSEVGIYALKGTYTNGNFTVTGNTNEGWEWDNLNIQENFYNAKYIAYNLNQNQITYNKLQPAEGVETGRLPSNGALRFYGYYPYNENAIIRETGDGSGRPLAPTIDIKIGEDEIETTDYLYTGPIEIPSSQTTPVNLHFKHALGKLNIFVYTEKTIRTNKPQITEMRIETYFSQEGKMNIETGKITPGEKEYYEFTKTFNTGYTISKSGSLNELTPIYSNMFIPNYSEDEQFLFNISLKIWYPKTEEEIIVNFSEDYLSDIVLHPGRLTNLYIKYNK